MPKKRKKNLQPRQQIKPSVPQVPTEHRHCASDTPKSSPTPATTPPPPPQKQLPTLFTTAEQDELLEMSENEAELVVQARMNEIFDNDGHDEKRERELVEACLLYTSDAADE